MLGNGKFPRKFDSPDDFLKNLSGELPIFKYFIFHIHHISQNLQEWATQIKDDNEESEIIF